jgi:hypothetical protein
MSKKIVKDLAKDLEDMKKKYDDLHNKYDQLEIRMESCKYEKIFKCENCEEHFSSHHHRKLHQKIHLQITDPIKCNICEKLSVICEN